MHTINRIKFFFIALLILASTSCKKYLEEYNPAGRTTETYYNTKQGFEDLVRSNYAPLRGIFNSGTLYWLGTDIFTQGLGTNISIDLNNYGGNLNSSLADVDTYWKQLYYSIQLTNTSLFWADKVTDMDAPTLAVRVAEAKALRALDYFLLVETFGDVPLVLAPPTAPTFGFVRTPEKEVYEQIIKDLTEATQALPDAAPANFGRVTKGMAQQLLAKVYLTRGYKSYGATTDFATAGQMAEAVINSGKYSLVSNFANLFDPTISNFQVNSEVIFSVQYSTNQEASKYSYITSPATFITGNNLHQQFTMDMSVYPAIGRSSFYNKSLLVVSPTKYFFNSFDKSKDARYEATVHTAIYAQVANGNFKVGDTVIYFPNQPWTPAQKAAVKYYVYNPDEYYTTTPFAQRSFPSFKKFREVGLAFADNLGTRDTYVFRLAETYLIAAEAYLKAGDMAKAVRYFNVVRVRAGKTGTNPATGVSYKDEMKVSTVTIDDILDERGRELAGEELRWFELKRTGRLVARTLAYNEDVKAAGRLNANNLLRPIPQSQIDLNRADFPQNPGY